MKNSNNLIVEATIKDLKAEQLPKLVSQALEYTLRNNLNTLIFNIEKSFDAVQALLLNQILKQNVKITALYISSYEINEEKIELLFKILNDNKIITSLDFSNTINFQVEGLKLLAQKLEDNENVNTLSLQDIRNINDGLKPLLEMLKNNKVISNLNLGKSRLGDKLAEDLAEILKENTSLTKLDLSLCNIGNRGVLAIAKSLMNNSSLTSLNLGINKITEQGVKFLAEMLKINKVIITIDIYGNTIKNEGAILLAQSLKENTSLINLNLDSCRIGYEGIIDLAWGLMINSSLIRLSLADNNIGPKGAIFIAEMLKKNTSLINLDLGYNKIQSEGTIAIGKSLMVNSSLTKLKLTNNQIYNEGIIALAQCLKNNLTLTILNFTGNLITSEGANALIELLKTYPFITELEIKKNLIPERQLIIIQKLLDDNLSVKTNSLLEKICALDIETLCSTNKVEGKKQFLLKTKLTYELPELLLKLTNEQIFEFNHKIKETKHVLSFSKFKECVTNIVDDQNLVENIFNNYANQTKFISNFIPILCAVGKIGRKTFLKKIKELEKLNEWEIIDPKYNLETIAELDLSETSGFYKSLDNFFKDKPLSVFTLFLELFREIENMVISEEVAKRIAIIIKYHPKLVETFSGIVNWEFAESPNEVLESMGDDSFSDN